VDNVASILLNCLRLALTALGDGTSQNGEAGHAFSVRVAETVVPDLLAALCFRFSSKDRNRLFDLVVQAYTHPLFRRGIGLDDSFKRLVKGLISSMPDQEILDQMPALLRLPIPQVDGFDVSYPSEWVEPFEAIQGRLEDLSIATPDSSLWQQPISQLSKYWKTLVRWPGHMR